MTAALRVPAALRVTALATDAAARRTHAIAAAPAAIVVAPGFVIAAHIAHAVIAAVSRAADADRASRHDEKRGAGNE
jgi:hypothetical protein